MNNAVVGGAVALVIGLSGVGAYVYIEQQKLQAAQMTTVAAASPIPAVDVQPPSFSSALSDLYGVPTASNSVMVSPTSKATVWFAQTVLDGTEKIYVAFIGRQEVDTKGELVNSSHASGVPLDAITYKLTEGKWNPTFKQSSFIEVGGWGEMQEAKQAEVLRLGNTTALLLEASSSGQGYTYIGKQILALESNGWKSLGNVNTGADNSGACEEDPKKITEDSMPACWSYSGTITAGAVAAGKAYPDLNVVRVGTMADDNRKIVAAIPMAVKFIGPQYEGLN